MPIQNMTRREAFGSVGGTGLLAAATLVGERVAAEPSPFARPAGCVSASAHGALGWTSKFLQYDALQTFRNSWRIQRSLADEADILHWYHFIMVAVPVGRAPQAVVRWEGIELSRHRRIGEHQYRLHGHNLSFARDLNTGAFVDRVRNPITGATVSPKTMTLTQDPGMLASPDGIIPLDAPKGVPRRKYTALRQESSVVKVDAIRVPPANWPGTFLEMGTEATPAQLFYDETLDWLPGDVSGAYVFPYPDWMEMGSATGHMFAYWSGYKLRDVEQLPPEFLKRAMAEHPELLQVDLAQFARPIAG